MEPKVILVDMLDNPLGELSKSQAHSSPRLHRAFSVFLYHDDSILIQQRAAGKYHSAGLWANACCSHPSPGEELFESAKKRLWEEAGIVASHLERLFAFTYMNRFRDDLYEYEYDHVLLGEYRGAFSPNPREAAQMRWATIPWLLTDLLEHPLHYAPWFFICAPRVFEIIAERS